ncbi:hypothetical protein FMM05_13170 [Flavobacterium zepuense]|uniref:Uncharacterized protein n=1 Tax=Flavobacterium zepuense TaxID=2593302 RepID=A0A552UZF5_9FLAO|nr:hypothetical protein [Flavobacterium zepuense]TRW23606.1 hypothetical protein FMM05_13170 [Flavobacterium zepuense]
MMTIEEIRTATAKLIIEGEVDVTYITQELIDEMNSQTPKEVSDVDLKEIHEGNSVYYDGTHTQWKKDCGNERWSWAGQHTLVRLVNCATGTIRHRIS